MARVFGQEDGDPEQIFDAFVRNHGSSDGARPIPSSDERARRESYARRESPARTMTRSGTVRKTTPGKPLPDWMRDEEREPTAEVVLLTKVKSGAYETDEDDSAADVTPSDGVREGVEDGQIPAGELDNMLSDMAVLVRYGHHEQVRQRLEELVREFPEDVLLLRRVVEFHMENGDCEGTMEMLFLLAGRLFERRNVQGMRDALQQVLVIEPDNRRAYKLLGLLEQRPSTGTGG